MESTPASQAQLLLKFPRLVDEEASKKNISLNARAQMREIHNKLPRIPKKKASRIPRQMMWLPTLKLFLAKRRSL
jgi:hypothetical protein